jgi:hypothetical protein
MFLSRGEGPRFGKAVFILLAVNDSLLLVVIDAVDQVFGRVTDAGGNGDFLRAVAAIGFVGVTGWLVGVATDFTAGEPSL